MTEVNKGLGYIITYTAEIILSRRFTTRIREQKKRARLGPISHFAFGVFGIFSDYICTSENPPDPLHFRLSRRKGC